VTQQRIDEVSQYYAPALKLKRVRSGLFWVIAALSLSMPYSTLFDAVVQNILQAVFLLLVLCHFLISQVYRFYLVPRAERMRRKHLLSDSFATHLSHDRTSLYYNNEYSPSVQRLGANTMENALFSKEVAARMLQRTRLVTGGYAIAWLLAFALRHNNLEILTWITQVVFSTEVAVQWLNLEILRFRCEQVYERLHAHFLHSIKDSPISIATILDAFVSYEAAKSSAGLLLSAKVFRELNPRLSEQWIRIRQELRMDRQHNAPREND
jgi:hypothetical protein